MDRDKYMTENPGITMPIIEMFEELMHLNRPEVDGAIFSLYVTYTSLEPHIPGTLADYLHDIVKDYLHSKVMCKDGGRNYSEETQKFLEEHKVSDEFYNANKRLINCIYGVTGNSDIEVEMIRQQALLANSAYYGCSGTIDHQYLPTKEDYEKALQTMCQVRRFGTRPETPNQEVTEEG